MATSLPELGWNGEGGQEVRQSRSCTKTGFINGLKTVGIDEFTTKSLHEAGAEPNLFAIRREYGGSIKKPGADVPSV